MRRRDIGDRVGITERAAYRIVAELADAGYIGRERNGRRNRYRSTPSCRFRTRSRASRTSGSCSRPDRDGGSERRVDRAGAAGDRGLLLAVGCALAGSVGVLLKQRGAVAAPVVLARHPVASAIGLFGSKWWTVGWLVAVGAWMLHVAALSLASLSLVQA